MLENQAKKAEMKNAFHLGTVRISAMTRGWECPSCHEVLIRSRREPDADSDLMLCQRCERSFAMPIEQVMAREIPWPGWK
jgi:transcription elongation factor Elf1